MLSLVLLRYVDEAGLSAVWKWVARLGAPIAPILIPAAFFLLVSRTATEPSGILKLVYPGAATLAAAVAPPTVIFTSVSSARASARRFAAESSFSEVTATR